MDAARDGRHDRRAATLRQTTRVFSTRFAVILTTALAAASCSQSELTNPSGTGGTAGQGAGTGGAGGSHAGSLGGAGQPSGTGGTVAGSAGAAGDQGGTAGASSAGTAGSSGVAGANGGLVATGGTAGGQPGTGGAGTATGGNGQAGAGAPLGGTGGASGTGGSTPAGGAGTGGAAGGTGSGGAASGGSGSGTPLGTGGAVATGSGGTIGTGSGGAAAGGASGNASLLTSTNTAGTAITLQLDGDLYSDAFGFYESLGSNDRTCASCHLTDQGMSLTAAGATTLFNSSDGTDPLFRLVDGAVSPLADVSTVDARRVAYALLLSKGLIRVGLPVPANADFDLVAVNDPYGYASAAELSLFRRPLPAANLRFLSTVMWDGREGSATGDGAPEQLKQALAKQASDATAGHAQGMRPVGSADLARIVAFEMGLYSAQLTGATAGPLDALMAAGGVDPLTQQNFYAGINDPAQTFDPNVFSTFAAWGSTTDVGADADARRQIALGEQIFNTRTFTVTGVTGLTTAAQPSVTVTCSFCHNTPAAGSSSTPRFFDLGLATGTRITSDMPSYTLRERSTGTQVTVSDPGRALITGAFADMSTFKVPTLRGLASRAPYFHNGSAGSLTGVVAFYNARFGIGLTTTERAALAAFLSAL